MTVAASSFARFIFQRAGSFSDFSWAWPITALQRYTHASTGILSSRIIINTTPATSANYIPGAGVGAVAVAGAETADGNGDSSGAGAYTYTFVAFVASGIN